MLNRIWKWINLKPQSKTRTAEDIIYENMWEQINREVEDYKFRVEEDNKISENLQLARFEDVESKG
jgi:hypothetical protein